MDEQFNKKDELESEIDLLELLKVVRKNFVFLISCTVVGLIIAFSFTYFMVPKTYRSVSTIYIKPTVTGGVVNYNEVLTNQKLTDTYAQIAKSKSVLNEVTEALSAFDLTEAQIRATLSINSIDNTEIISISSITTDPELSAEIANKVVTVFISQVETIMKIDNLRVLDKAEPVYLKVGPNTQLNTLIGGFLGLGLATAYVLIKKLMDRTIHGRQDAETLLQLPVLGEIAYYEDGTL